MKMKRRLKVIVNSPPWPFILERTILAPMSALLRRSGRIDVLELGSGRGDTTRLLARWMPAARIVASDIDPAQVSSARKRLSGAAAEIRVVDATSIPFPDESFDMVVEFDAFHHIADWPSAIAECARVLRPGGTFAAADVSSPFFGRFMRWFDAPEAIFSVREFIEAAERAGFRLAEDRSSDRFVRCTFIRSS